MTDRPAKREGPPWPVTAAAAWLLPGLGHYLIGYRRRGLILGVTLLSLFFAGVLVGGVGVVDRHRSEQRLWFIGQALIGPSAYLVDVYRQNREQHLQYQFESFSHILRSQTGRHVDEATVTREFLQSADPPPALRRSLGRVNELGILYATLAGVLNLLVILDVIGRSASAPIHPAPPPDDEPDNARNKKEADHA